MSVALFVMSDPEPCTGFHVGADVIFGCNDWHSSIDSVDLELECHISNVMRITLNHLGMHSRFQSIDATFLLTDDEEIRKLNLDFRGKDYPTNVLSFPAYPISKRQNDCLSAIEGNLFLGDIAISYQRIHCESIEQMKTFSEHLTHILVHAILHLLGYDHIQDDEAEQMERLEIEIMKIMGFNDPYNMNKVIHTLRNN